MLRLLVRVVLAQTCNFPSYPVAESIQTEKLDCGCLCAVEWRPAMTCNVISRMDRTCHRITGSQFCTNTCRFTGSQSEHDPHRIADHSPAAEVFHRVEAVNPVIKKEGLSSITTRDQRPPQFEKKLCARRKPSSWKNDHVLRVDVLVSCIVDVLVSCVVGFSIVIPRSASLGWRPRR